MNWHFHADCLTLLLFLSRSNMSALCSRSLNSAWAEPLQPVTCLKLPVGARWVLLINIPLPKLSHVPQEGVGSLWGSILTDHSKDLNPQDQQSSSKHELGKHRQITEGGRGGEEWQKWEWKSHLDYEKKSVIIFCPCGRDRCAKVSLSFRIFSQDREGYIGKRMLGVWRFRLHCKQKNHNTNRME